MDARQSRNKYRILTVRIAFGTRESSRPFVCAVDEDEIWNAARDQSGGKGAQRVQVPLFRLVQNLSVSKHGAVFVSLNLSLRRNSTDIAPNVMGIIQDFSFGSSFRLSKDKQNYFPLSFCVILVYCCLVFVFFLRQR